MLLMMSSMGNLGAHVTCTSSHTQIPAVVHPFLSSLCVALWLGTSPKLHWCVLLCDFGGLMQIHSCHVIQFQCFSPMCLPMTVFFFTAGIGRRNADYCSDPNFVPVAVSVVSDPPTEPPTSDLPTGSPTSETPTEAPTSEAPTQPPTSESPTEAPTSAAPTSSAPTEAEPQLTLGVAPYGLCEG